MPSNLLNLPKCIKHFIYYSIDAVFIVFLSLLGNCVIALQLLYYWKSNSVDIYLLICVTTAYKYGCGYVLKGMVQPFVSSSEQIWRNLALHHLLTNGSEVGAIRMRVQTADKSITPVHQLTSYKAKTCIF